MARLKRGKGKRRYKHQKQPKEPDTALLASNTPNGDEHGRIEEVTYADGTTKYLIERTQIVTDAARPALTASQRQLSRSVNASDSGTSTVGDSDGFEALLEELTGADLTAARLIVQALQTPEDLSRLRRLAVTHGFINDRIRAVVWPRLLGLRYPVGSGLKLGQLPSFPFSHGRHRSDDAVLPQPRGPAPHPQRQAPAHEPPPDNFKTTCTCSLPQTPRVSLQAGTGALPSTADPLPAEQLCAAAALRQRDGGVEEANTNNALGEAMAPSSPGSVLAEDSKCFSSAVFAKAKGCGDCDAAVFHGVACGVTLTTAPCNGATVVGNRSGSEGAGACIKQDSEVDIGSAVLSEQHVEQEGPGQLDPSFGSSWRGGRDQQQRNRDLESWDTCQDYRRRECDSRGSHWDWDQYLRWSQQPHRDSAVVEVDVARSLWAFTRDLSEQQRDVRRQQLKRLLNAVVASCEGDVFYYQGLHDVASVLLMSMPGCEPLPPQLTPPSEPCRPDTAPAHPATWTSPEPDDPDSERSTQIPLITPPGCRAAASAAAAAACGELLAFALLRRLATTHLRDATRPSLDPVVQLLGLMPYLVRATDPALANHLAGRGLQPFFALSWFLTWWAHELDELSSAARLFDFFLSSHPLMPLYLGAVAMRSQRSALLACDDMPELHSALTNLKIVAPNDGVRADRGSGKRTIRGSNERRASVAGVAGTCLPLKELLRQAEQLWRAKPPHTLVPLQPTRGSLRPSQQRLRHRRSGAGRSDGGKGDGELTMALTACVAHAATMEGQPALWKVPHTAPAEWPNSMVIDGRKSGLGRILSRANSVFGGKSRTTLLSTALLAGVYVAAAVAIGYATLSRATVGQQ